jgi:hypothetical protein
MRTLVEVSLQKRATVLERASGTSLSVNASIGKVVARIENSCIPGEMRTCIGPDGCVGLQSCPDERGFGGCHCGMSQIPGPTFGNPPSPLRKDRKIEAVITDVHGLSVWEARNGIANRMFAIQNCLNTIPVNGYATGDLVLQMTVQRTGDVASGTVPSKLVGTLVNMCAMLPLMGLRVASPRYGVEASFAIVFTVL